MIQKTTLDSSKLPTNHNEAEVLGLMCLEGPLTPEEEQMCNEWIQPRIDALWHAKADAGAWESGTSTRQLMGWGNRDAVLPFSLAKIRLATARGMLARGQSFEEVAKRLGSRPEHLRSVLKQKGANCGN